MEKNIEIQTGDNHTIYGVLSGQEKVTALIIFVHGLTGHKNEHIFYNAAKFFPKHGFSTFRFDLYTGEKNGRLLSESSVATHSRDVEQVLTYFQKDFKNIYVVGHSLGGPTILCANIAPVQSVVLWDPSFDPTKGLLDEVAFDPRINKHILSWGTEFLLSDEMIKEWKTFGDSLLPKFSKPTKIICAGEGVLYKDWQKNISSIQVEHELFVIEKAGHCFDEEDTEDILFHETLRWFQK
jgi:pimeloyl-ACP methyl ester carboxylesterase